MHISKCIARRIPPSERFCLNFPWRNCSNTDDTEKAIIPMKSNFSYSLIALLTLCLWLPPVAAQDSSENATEAHGEGQLGEYRGAMETTHPGWFKQSFLEFEEDIAEAAEEGRRLMLYFHQDGCPYCNKLVEHNFTNAVLGDKVQQHFDVVAINMWGDREVVQVGGRPFTEKTLASALNVNLTPTLLFFNEERKVVLRLDGYLPPEDFEVALDYVAGRLENSETYSDYVAERQNGSDTGELNVLAGTLPPPHDLENRNKDRILAVLFEEPDCDNCDLLHQKTFQDPGAGSLLEQLDVIQLNRWAETPVTLPDGTQTTARQWARELEIGYSPAILLLDAAGDEIMKINAQFRTFHILGALDYAVSGDYRSEPNFQRYLSAKAEAIREQGKDVDIWKY